jgi:uncharacterized membrane protein YkoI
MTKFCRLLIFSLMLCSLALLPAIAHAQNNRRANRGRVTKKATTTDSTSTSETQKKETASTPKLPDAVKKTLNAKFPNAKIDVAEAEKEGDATVYDIEFREGRTQMETDIKEDGTMLEYTTVVSSRSVPKDAMKPISAAAKGGKIGRTEKVELSYELKDGKWVKLDKPTTHYEVEMTKGDESASIIVDSHGKVIEEPKWHAAKKETKSAA